MAKSCDREGARASIKDAAGTEGNTYLVLE
jgi:hypothetical protein